ncbi:YdeI/OmpD-associated family protein [Chitinophaga qingshengii]|uniref:YdeI/OmpD-associated family protein n=1 Tax=Chitinophaga qingshengii TaxID=1569794 RepID=A0ABR7TKC0_9BACT|nr:YdeI/OmpD-associated family protein [Chitinophaga qingshengii]MBC9930936.1 YdeI/OmpD-associated family protein [Chitinophaga qingshengii]
MTTSSNDGPTFFETGSAFRKWLDKHHHKAEELLVGFYKVGSGKKSMSWSESVDEAICYGWIDGVRKTIDEESYTIRFTPRKHKSIWSAVNVKKVEDLTREGRMMPAGIAAFNKREMERTAIYTYERADPLQLSEAYERQLRANQKAWEFYQKMPPSYRKLTAHWIMSGKQEATRDKRLAELIRDCAAGTKVKKYNY